MSGDVHVRFWESAGVRFPSATRFGWAEVLAATALPPSRFFFVLRIVLDESLLRILSGRRHSMANPADRGLFKRGNRWWIRLSVEGKGQVRLPLAPRGQSKGTTDKTVARQIARRVRAELLGRTGQRTCTRDLGELLDEFVEVKALRGKPATGKRSRTHCRAFLAQQKVKDPAEITVAAVESHLAHLQGLGRAVKTLWNVRTSISTFCTFLVNRDLLDENPTRRVDLAKPERLPARFLTEEQVVELIALADELTAQHGDGLDVAIALALQTGLRRGELRRLAWADVDVAGKRLVVRTAKSGKFRVAWLNPAAIAVLERQRERTGDRRYVFAGREGPGDSGMRHTRWWDKAFRPIQV